MTSTPILLGKQLVGLPIAVFRVVSLRLKFNNMSLRWSRLKPVEGGVGVVDGWPPFSLYTWKPSKWALQKERSLPNPNIKGQAVSCCRRVNLSIQWWFSTFHDLWIFEGTVLGIYNEGTSMRCIVLHVSRLCCGLKHLWDGQAVWLSLRLQPWAIPVCIYRYTEQNMVIAMGV